MPKITIDEWTEILRRNKPGSKLQPPFEKQRELIRHLFEPDPDNVKQVDLCCGRGYGKSVLDVFIATMALSLSPNEIGLFLEPDWKRVRRVFLRKWASIVPSHFYEHNKTEQCIKWLPTGSLLYYGPRNITGAHSAADDSQLGQDTTFIIDDEAALRCSLSMYLNNLPTIREPSKVRFYLTTSTPRVGPYHRLVTADGHKLFRGKSDDNPYLPSNYVEQLRANMSPEQARRELGGEFVSLEGRVWANWVEDGEWPNSNVYPGEYGDWGDNFTLSVDLGNRGAWGIWQRIPAIDPFTGSVIRRTPLSCLVAEWQTNDGNSRSMVSAIDNIYGRPSKIIVGHDVNRAHGETDGIKPAMIFSGKWPGVQIISPRGWQTDKETQHWAMQTAIQNSFGQRQMVIASGCRHHTPESGRTLPDLMRLDAWPDGELTLGAFFSKDKQRGGPGLEDERDMVLYYVICTHPPEARRETRTR